MNELTIESTPNEIMDIPVAIGKSVEFFSAGLIFNPEFPLTSKEWLRLGSKLGRAARLANFWIGDWLNYGESRKEYGEKYDEAMNVTHLDNGTLRNYAYVAARVDLSHRHDNLFWQHHVNVASIEDPEDRWMWLDLAADLEAAGEPMSAVRLSRSINAGKLITPKKRKRLKFNEDLNNVVPHVDRIRRWWSQMQKAGWYRHATPDQKMAVARDLEPVVQIYQQIKGLPAKPEPNAATALMDPAAYVASVKARWKKLKETGDVGLFAFAERQAMGRELATIKEIYEEIRLPGA